MKPSPVILDRNYLNQLKLKRARKRNKNLILKSKRITIFQFTCQWYTRRDSISSSFRLVEDDGRKNVSKW